MRWHGHQMELSLLQERVFLNGERCRSGEQNEAVPYFRRGDFDKVCCKEASMGDPIKQQFGNYRLVKSIGEGGFGKVHLGKHLDADTAVAIKIFDTRLISREQKDFLQEARVIASLNHPSIVHLLDSGIEGDEPFLVMNYAPGGT